MCPNRSERRAPAKCNEPKIRGKITKKHSLRLPNWNIRSKFCSGKLDLNSRLAISGSRMVIRNPKLPARTNAKLEVKDQLC